MSVRRMLSAAPAFLERNSRMSYGDLQQLDGRVALVTGAGAGIGEATARALAEFGAHVAITDVDVDAAQRVAASLAAAEAHHLDVADEQQVVEVVQSIAAEHGRIDILVNNVGAAARAPAVELETERWHQVMDIGPAGSFRCAREVGRHMLAAKRGSVVNVASIMGLVGGSHYPNIAYHTAKGAIVNFTRGLACEWAPSGVRVNAVAPTWARTSLTEALLADEDMARRLIDETPLGRFVEPEEVAAGILFLASDAASMITGHTLPIDGGWLAH